MWRFLRHTTGLLRHQGHYKQGYYIKVYQGYYVTVTLANHRPFQNRPTLDAKKMHFCSSESRESRIIGISALKTIVLRNKTKLFFDLQLVNFALGPYSYLCVRKFFCVRTPIWYSCLLAYANHLSCANFGILISSVRNIGILVFFLRTPVVLSRHRLGCFCTHHSLGGRIRPPCYLENGWT